MKIYNGGNRVVNAFVYPISEGYVMIDTGYENSFLNVQRKLLKQGIKIEEIKYIFLTHAHDDHAGFLKELLDKYPNIKVILNEKSIPILAKGQNPFIGGCSSLLALFFCNIMKLFGNGQHLFPALDENYRARMIAVSPENKKDIEDILKGTILFTPGHTYDSISLKVDDVIFCGDAAMNGVPSLNRITIWVENKTEFKDSWNIMINENARCIYPGHGKAFATKELAEKKSCISKIKLHELKH